MTHTILLAATLLAAAPAFAANYDDAGSRHPLGESAIVPHLVPAGPEVPIELEITSVEEGSMDDLSGFEIPAELRDARPLYVRYEYTNRSKEDLSNQIVGAFFVVDDRDQEHAPALAMSGGGASFTACRSDAARDLTPGETYEGCLLFMLHEEGDVEAVGYRGGYRHETGQDTQAKYPIYYDPILWTVERQAEAPASGGTLIVR